MRVMTIKVFLHGQNFFALPLCDCVVQEILINLRILEEFH